PPARPRRRSRPRQRRRRPRPTRRSARRRRGAATARPLGRCRRAPPRRYMRSTLDAQMALQAELLETTEALEPHLAGWDALAVARGRPYCAPGWMLSWLGAVAPPDALLRACVVREGAELVAIAPLWTQDGDAGGRYGMLSEHTASPVEPLCVAGREGDVAAAFGQLLAEANPGPREIELKGAPAASPWPRLLSEHVPGYSPPSIECTRVMALPKLRLDQPSLNAWLATRSRN